MVKKPKGSPKTPGSGRVKGTPNKATVEKQRVAAEIAAQTIADARVTGKKLAKEVLADFMELFAGMASVYQPMPPGVVNSDPKRAPSEEKFDRYAKLAVDAARMLAPYQSPTFQAILIPPPPPDPNQNEQRRRFTLTIFEGGKPTMEIMPPAKRANGGAS